jgi:hypothetical protein
MDQREQWEQDLRDRQRHNYVFPGTVVNSTWALRKLVNQAHRSPLQKAGIVLYLLPYCALAGTVAWTIYRAIQSPDFEWGPALSDLAIIGAITGSLLLIVVAVLAFIYRIQKNIDYNDEKKRNRVRARQNIPVGRIRRRR